MNWLKEKLRHKFGYALSGVLSGLRNDSSIALQCVLGLITIIVCLFLPLSALGVVRHPDHGLSCHCHGIRQFGH